MNILWWVTDSERGQRKEESWKRRGKTENRKQRMKSRKVKKKITSCGINNILYVIKHYFSFSGFKIVVFFKALHTLYWGHVMFHKLMLVGLWFINLPTFTIQNMRCEAGKTVMPYYKLLHTLICKFKSSFTFFVCLFVSYYGPVHFTWSASHHHSQGFSWYFTQNTLCFQEQLVNKM